MHVAAIQEVTFCMVTAMRPNNTSYVEHVLSTYTQQNVNRMDGVALALIDVDGSTVVSGVYGGVRLENRKYATCDTPDVEGIPSCQVRQRSLDVTGALLQCAKLTSAWVVLVEDDCEVCTGVLQEALTALAALNARDIAMAKLSKNMCATAFPVQVIPAYVEATLSRLYTHPHDIIDTQQWAPRLQLYRYERNLFHHVGHISTEQHKNKKEWQDLYASMREDHCGGYIP